MHRYALIVAGGAGKRMGSTIPKQFLELSGRPVLMHTVERFAVFDRSMDIILVLPADYIPLWSELCKDHSFAIPHKIITGGSLRYFSVRNGLEIIPDGSIVAIHDGVRPLVSMETLGRCFATAAKEGNAVPVISPSDSLRLVTRDSNQPLDRNDAKLIQTPQVFRADLIKKAYLRDYQADFTDDATVLEKSGVEIHLVEGNRENIKITTPSDLAVAEALLPFIF